ncbi:MAG: hypothetical protein Q9M39_01950 [Sulfurovum sp.]|nr:hypothetical protein [Sulfurovum sp.]
MKPIEIQFSPANPDIIQNFVELEEFYPPLHESENDYPSVKAWLKQIRLEGFSEEMMKEIILYYFRLIKKEKYEESAQLILVSCATHHDNACYILARELFRGLLFEANPSASFGMFSTLARGGHAEALCDLALFLQKWNYRKKEQIPRQKTL